MSTTSGKRNPVEALAEEFLERKRRGEDATPEDYAEQHPELAGEILALFPALLMMEDLGGDSVERTGSVLTGGGAIGGVTSGRLGEFRLLREVGRGGMGVVYEAEQQSLGRRVALKVLPQGAITDTRQLRRFEREARSAARLHHTNIVPVFGVGEHEGTHFYVMQFIQGQGLDAVLNELRRLRDARTAAAGQPATAMRTDRQRPAADIALSLATGRFAAGPGNGGPVSGTATLPWAANDPLPGLPSASETGQSSFSSVSTFTESNRKFAQGVARIGVQVAEALAYAHGQGILHRDIKPSNLLLDRDGNVWVADFGLAKAVGSDDLTHTGDIVGTVRYMAPERFQGEGDTRADIYALGLTLYEMLALRPAFDEADRAKLIHRVTQEDPPRLRKLNCHVPPDLETIVHKAIAREPAQRYATAQAVVEDLNRFLEGRPILARRVSTAEQAWRWCKRNPWLAGLAAALLLALVSGTIVSSILAARAREQAGRAELEAMRANQTAADLKSSLDRSTALTGQLKSSLHESDRRMTALHFEQAQVALEKGETGIGLHRLIECWRSAVAAGDRDWQETARRSLAAWQREYPTPSLVFQMKQFNARAFTRSSIELSEDGKTLISAEMNALFSRNGEVRRWDVATGLPLEAPLALPDISNSGSIPRYAIRRDAGAIVHTRQAAGKSEVVALDVASGRVLGHPIELERVVGSLALAPDGKTVAISQGTAARLWDIGSGKPLGPPLTHSSYINSMEFSPDGKTLAICGNGESLLWDVATKQPLGAPLVHMKGVNAARFSPDGKSVVICCGSTLVRAAGESGEARQFDTRTGRQIGPVLTHRQGVGNAVFSPDGKTLATSTGSIWSKTGEVQLWEAATGRPLGAGLVHRGGISSMAFRRDGQRLITASHDRTARIWDVATGRPLGPAFVHRGAVLLARFVGDGATALTASGDGTASLWDATSAHAGSLPISGSNGVFLRDGESVFTSGNGIARLLDAATGHSLGPPLFLQNSRSFYEAVCSPTGLVATADDDLVISFVDSRTGRPTDLRLPADSSGWTDLAFSPDGRILFTKRATVLLGTETPQLFGRLWEVASGTPIGAGASVPVGPNSYLYSFFSPDSRLLFLGKSQAADGKGGNALLWEVATGKRLAPDLAVRGGIRSAAFSPDGKTLATMTSDSGDRSGTAQVWSLATRQPIGAAMPLSGRPLAIRFSPDGQRLLTVSFQYGSRESEVRLWDATSGRPLGPPLQTGMVVSAAFHPGSQMVATNGINEIRLWNPATGRPIGPSAEGQELGNTVEFSPDGATLLAAGMGTSARLLEVSDLADDLERAAVWVQAITGLDVNERGDITPLDEAAWKARRERLASLGGPPVPPARWRFDPILASPDPTARARAWADRGCWAEAEAAYDEAVSTWPDNAHIRAQRGQFLASRGQADRAETDDVTACSLGLASNLPEAAEIQPKIFNRENLFRRVLTLQPSAAPALLNRRAAYWLRSGSWMRAAADLREADRLERLTPIGLCNLAAALHAAGHRDEARGALALLFERFGDTPHPEWVYEIVQTALQVSDPGISLDVIRQMIERMPSLPTETSKADGLLSRGLLLYREGRYADAIQCLDEALKLRNRPRSGFEKEWAPLALAHHRLGHLDEARRLAKLLREVNLSGRNIRELLLKPEAEAVILYDPIFPAGPFVPATK